ncbi:MAG: LuxR C-terminal-related transcriptional regulator [Bacillota bacterium]|nr:LuxR C-terminal-related transcriptional regulator [Bacillota bacterium]
MYLKVIYGIIAIISLILIAGYYIFIKKKNVWFMLLYISVFIVNAGYFALASTGSLNEALMANRISYLGSVLLPLCMLMIIMDVCKCEKKKAVLIVAICVSAVVFLIAASQGYCDWYYEHVILVSINGASRLLKVYGPLHNVYYVYLFTYLIAMVCIILFAYIRKKAIDYKRAIFLTLIVTGNIFVWLIEQLIDMDFEFLSISYIVTEIFLLFMYMVLQDIEKIKRSGGGNVSPDGRIMSLEEIIESNPELSNLTGREKEVLKLILEDVKRKDIADRLSVSENTIKKHTANIFSKLEVASRKELYDKIEYRP